MTDTLISPYSNQLLEKLQYQGQRNDCGPFTTATVLNALLGLEIDALQLAEEMNRPSWRGPMFIVRRVPNWATFPWGIVDVLRTYGLRAQWRAFNSKEFLLQHLVSDCVLMPIIGEYRPQMWAHVMSLVTWDPEKGWGFANTQYDRHVANWVSDETFQRRWRNMARIVVEVHRG